LKLLSISLILGVIAYLGLIIALFVLQRAYIYYPDETYYTPTEANITKFKAVTMTASTQKFVSWWREPPNPDGPIILYFHGNAGSLAYYAYELNMMAGWNIGVLAVGYPGYGGNDGHPTEKSLYAAAQQNYDWLLKQRYSPEKIVLFGHSLGSGVSVNLASKVNAAGLIVSAPFTSMAAMAQKQLPYLPSYFLVRDRYDSLTKISQINMPVAWVHGSDDLLIPQNMGQRLYDNAKNPKCFRILPDTGHNNVWAKGGDIFVREQVNAFTTQSTCLM